MHAHECVDGDEDGYVDVHGDGDADVDVRVLLEMPATRLSTVVNRLIRRSVEEPGLPEIGGVPRSSFPTSRGARPIAPEDVAAVEDVTTLLP